MSKKAGGTVKIRNTQRGDQTCGTRERGGKKSHESGTKKNIQNI